MIKNKKSKSNKTLKNILIGLSIIPILFIGSAMIVGFYEGFTGKEISINKDQQTTEQKTEQKPEEKKPAPAPEQTNNKIDFSNMTTKELYDKVAYLVGSIGKEKNVIIDNYDLKSMSYYLAYAQTFKKIDNIKELEQYLKQGFKTMKEEKYLSLDDLYIKLSKEITNANITDNQKLSFTLMLASAKTENLTNRKDIFKHVTDKLNKLANQ